MELTRKQLSIRFDQLSSEIAVLYESFGRQASGILSLGSYPFTDDVAIAKIIVLHNKYLASQTVIHQKEKERDEVEKQIELLYSIELQSDF